jgi:hypothetical protein
MVMALLRKDVYFAIFGTQALYIPQATAALEVRSPKKLRILRALESAVPAWA